MNSRRLPWNSSMYDRTLLLRGMSTSCGGLAQVDSRRRSASPSSARAARMSKSSNRRSIDAGSDFFSANPSPWASAVISWALMRSTRRSKCWRMRGSVRAPYGDFRRTRPPGRRNPGLFQMPHPQLTLAVGKVPLRFRDQLGNRIGRGRRRDLPDDLNNRGRRGYRRLDGLRRTATGRDRHADAESSCHGSSDRTVIRHSKPRLEAWGAGRKQRSTRQKNRSTLSPTTSAITRT